MYSRRILHLMRIFAIINLNRATQSVLHIRDIGSRNILIKSDPNLSPGLVCHRLPPSYHQYRYKRRTLTAPQEINNLETNLDPFTFDASCIGCCVIMT